MTERATALAKLRDVEGYVCDLSLDGEDGFALIEYHNPLEKIAAQYPTVVRMEEALFTRVLQVPVRRSEDRASALTRYVFHIDAKPDLPESAPAQAEADALASNPNGLERDRPVVASSVQLVG